MASADLVTVAFVEVVYGADVDETRCATLITLASDIVREYCGTTWDDTTVPAQIKLAVAQMVGDAFSNTPADEASVKAEQIGDYRVEYARASMLSMSTGPYKDVLDKYRRSAYSINAGVPFDGVVVTNESA